MKRTVFGFARNEALYMYQNTKMGFYSRKIYLKVNISDPFPDLILYSCLQVLDFVVVPYMENLMMRPNQNLNQFPHDNQNIPVQKLLFPLFYCA